MSQYQVLTNLVGGAVPLETAIDNTRSSKLVGLREFTYVTGWYNISTTLGNNTFLVRRLSTDPGITYTVPNGYYNADRLGSLVTTAVPGSSFVMDRATGRVTFFLTDQSWQLNLSTTALISGYSSEWWGSGLYRAPMSPLFFNKRTLSVCLDQINTTDSVLNGRNSTLLRLVPTSGEAYGEARTVTFDDAQFRRLRGGSVQELSLRVLDDCGTDISSFVKPYSATLEITDSTCGQNSK